MNFLRLVILSLGAAMIAGCGDGKLGPPPTPTPGPGNAFVFTANAGGNSISGFKNDSTGALTPVSGSPFSSPGQPFGIAAGNGFLYVSSFQNAVVSVLSINSTTGSLTPVTCTPVASTGPQPLKIAITPSGKFLYTSNQGGNVSGFTINTGTGCLTAVSTTLADSVPRGLTVERTGQFLYVVTGGGGIDVFAINVDGTLTRQSLAGFNTLSGTMLAVKASPTSDVMIATDGGNANNFITFIINTNNGIITPITASAATTLTPSAIAYNTVADPNNPAFYIANTGSNNFTASSIAPNGAPNSAAAVVPVSTGPVDLASDPSGKFVYVANNGSSTVSVFNANITSGNVNSVFIGSGNTGSGPQSIVVVGHP